MKRRLFLASAAMLLSTFGAGTSVALSQDDYPSKPIHIVVAWPAGGGHDIVARLLGQQLSTALDVPVVVDNVTGAGGSTGTRHLVSAQPDGYTIGIIGMHAVSQSFMNVNAPSLDQFDPITYIAEEPGALQVLSQTGITTVDEYVEAMKADPNSLINGNDPQGGNSFVFANVIKDELGVEMMQVPYQGHAPNVTALVTGEIQTATLPVTPVLEHVRAGTVNMLAVASSERHPLLPDVPTFAEAGYEINVNDFVMVAAPVGIPEEVRAKLEQSLLDAVNSDGFMERAQGSGLVVKGGGADEAGAELSRQTEVIYPLLDGAGLVAPTLRR